MLSVDEVVFAGTEQAGVFTSLDGGRTWHPSSLRDLTVTSLALSFDSVIFAGTSLGGIFRSVDGGDMWTASGMNEIEIRDLESDASGFIYASTAEGLYRSDDHGQSWVPLDVDNPPATSGLLVTPSGALVVADSPGLYRSEDHGETWIRASVDIGEPGIYQFAADSSGILYAGLSKAIGACAGGVFRSSDDGRSWRRINSPSRCDNVSLLTVDKLGQIIVGTERSPDSKGSGFYVSNDDGESWQDASYPGYIATSFAHTENDRRCVGTIATGVFCAEADAFDWLPANQGLTASVLSVLVSDQGGEMFAAGTSGVYTFLKTLSKWEPINNGLGENPSTHALIDGPSADLFAGTDRGVLRFDRENKKWIETGLAIPTWSLAVSSNDVLLAGTNGSMVWRSSDHGATWTQGTSLGSGLVWTLTAAAGGEVYASTIAGESQGVLRSDDDGATWTHIGLDSLFVRDILLDRTDRLFSATRIGLYYSDNGGHTWTQSELGGTSVLALGMDEQGSIYAATVDGLFTSGDSGETWSHLETPRLFSTLGFDRESFIYAATTGHNVVRSVHPTSSMGDRRSVSLPLSLGCYPNPFTSSTRIAFALPAAGHTTITLYSLLGQKISTLLSGYMPAGAHNVRWAPTNLASGPYLYRLDFAGRFSEVKVLLIRR